MAKILVVDDDTGYNQSLQDALSSCGYEVEAAMNASDAGAIATDFRPDILVVDWMLGAESGHRVANALQAEQPGVKAILITGFSAEDARADAEQAEFIAVLEKPFKLAEICALINSAMSGRKT